jgi:hypothetical protein
VFSDRDGSWLLGELFASVPSPLPGEVDDGLGGNNESSIKGVLASIVMSGTRSTKQLWWSSRDGLREPEF